MSCESWILPFASPLSGVHINFVMLPVQDLHFPAAFFAILLLLKLKQKKLFVSLNTVRQSETFLDTKCKLTK